MSGVDAPDGEISWSYTIGLASNYQHPELVVVGLAAGQSGQILNELGSRVRDGTQLRPRRSEWLSDGTSVELVPVHPRHFETDVFARWVDYYASPGHEMPTPEALEVVVPDQWFCSSHGSLQPALATPLTFLMQHGSSRAQRRAAHRHRS